MKGFVQFFLPTSFSNRQMMSSTKLLKIVLKKIMLVTSFESESVSNIVKLLAMAQNSKRNPSVTHVSKLNGLDKLIGRSLGESELLLGTPTQLSSSFYKCSLDKSLAAQ
jgi:hypothetical protein